jgi:2-oxoglutarate dehydrogenase E1 component
MDAERSLSSHNIAFLEALYEQYERDPSSVDPAWRQLIEYEQSRAGNGHAAALPRERRAGRTTMPPAEVEQVALQNQVDRLIEHYRLLGHLRADLDPLGRERREHTEALDLEYFRLDEEHLDRLFNAGRLFDTELVPLGEILGKLQRTYCRRIGVEYWQIQDVEIRNWLREYMESRENEVLPSHEEQCELLRQLARADEVDKFLHQKFIGAKRFSVAGSESVIALLHTLLDEACELGVTETLIGMAHRGRLSVMMNVMGQTPAQIFSRFEGGDPWENLGSGDVKYHLGCYRTFRSHSGKEMYLALAFNPSHLEAISPVIAGRVRASQDRLPDDRRSSVLGVTMHGDAAVMGQGVYAETLNLSRLPGYANDGSIRIVVNNQVGFTTDPIESRSTVYPTAVADMLNAPVFHLNGDDPEAAAYVGKLAIAFRQRFHQDVIIDLVGYRRYGHNEGDEPTFTQPEMYARIKKHPTVRAIYEERLLERGTVSKEDVEAMEAELRQELEDALAEVRASARSLGKAAMHGIWEDYDGGDDDTVTDVETKVAGEVLDRIGEGITRVPEGFALHRKLDRFVRELGEMAKGEAPLSWAACEHLAYGSLLVEGHSVRLSGQDTIRGTFTHRHLAWVDAKTGERYFPLQHLAKQQGRLHAYNSPLSEFAVMGFEFGYSLAAPDVLLIWEAQFGDFVNGAQVIIDQFLSSSEDKWNRLSGLVLFLPHGYEGQGPEHSSARLERFLQLCAEDNMQVCNLTTPGQLFHALRRQIHRRWRKPLILMTPKSLLRTRASFSERSVLTDGRFQRFIGDDGVVAKDVRFVMACTGKVYYDLAAEREKRGRGDVAIVRCEQLYPFPAQALEDELRRFPNVEQISWVQEEPQNMGAWTFMAPRLELAARGRCKIVYVGRVASASPATGSPESHKLEQELILKEAFGDPDAE